MASFQILFACIKSSLCCPGNSAIADHADGVHTESPCTDVGRYGRRWEIARGKYWWINEYVTGSASIHLVIGLAVALGLALLLSALLIVIAVIRWKRVKRQNTRHGSPSPETQGTVTAVGRNVREDYTTLNTVAMSTGTTIYETITPGVVFTAKPKAPGDNDYVNIPNTEAAYYNKGNY